MSETQTVLIVATDYITQRWTGMGMQFATFCANLSIKQSLFTIKGSLNILPTTSGNKKLCLHLRNFFETPKVCTKTINRILENLKLSSITVDISVAT